MSLEVYAMTRTTPRGFEIGRRGIKLYEEKLRSIVETPENIGKIISIDIDSEDYAIADDPITAADMVYARHPNARQFGARIGYDAMYGVGGSVSRTTAE